ATQGLGAEDDATDALTVSSVDGTDSETITVNVTGANDNATIGGDAMGGVTEDIGVVLGNLTSTGTLSVADADAGESSFAVQVGTVGLYGTFNLSAAGVWDYSANNANPLIQALGAGDTLTESFVVESADGTTHSVTITINGADEANLAPTDIHLTMTHVPTGSTLPNGSAIPLTLGTLSTADPDVGNTHMYSIEPGSSAGFAITGSSLQTSIALVEGLTYTLNLKSTDSGSPAMSYPETLHIIAGTSAGDVALMGTTGDDVIYGLGGADTITGSSGDDTIYGQNGGDTLSGGDGADFLDGGGSADTLRGNDGRDVLIGAGGNDRLYGGAGDDLIDAGGSGDQDIVFYDGVLNTSDVLSNGSDMIVNFDADALAGGQDRINLDALFDSLGVANAGRSARVSIADGTEIRINMDGNTTFEYLLATVTTSSGTLDITDLVLS
ncbi:MAG: VCBS domain-containing protein, partial [Burkholderiales bacterium]